MAISQLGELQISYDEWKTTVYVDPSNAYYDDFMKPDMTLQPYNNLNAMQHYDVNGSYVTGGIRFASITYGSLPGSTDKYWIISGEYQLFAIKDIPTNYNTNGSLKLENVFQLVITNGALDPNTVTSNSDIMVVTGNMASIYYAEVADFDLVSATKTVTFQLASITSTYGTGVFGSNAYNGSEYMTIGRDTGIILTSTTGKTWTVKTATSFLYQDGTSMIPSSTGEYAGALPMYTTNPFNPTWARNGNGWGGLTYADGLWIVVNAKPAPSTISQYWSPFLFSEDGVLWSAYKPTQAELNVNYGYSMYKIAFGYGKFFATNSNPNQVNTTQPPIYRLLMNEIPAHRKLVAEKGIDVMGKIRLLDLPNASSLATDAEGNIIEGSGGGASDGKVKVSSTDATSDYLGSKLVDSATVTWEIVDDAGTETIKANIVGVGNGYFPTMDPACAIDVVMPSLNGSRTEVIVIANPRASYKITQGSTSKMGCAVLQGATGELVITVRDVNLNLIAESYVRTNPTSDTMLEINCGVVYDPITHVSIPDYVLESGIPYYLGINYSTNGCSFWGIILIQCLKMMRMRTIQRIIHHLITRAGLIGTIIRGNLEPLFILE
jgi:hypothetical protein